MADLTIWHNPQCSKSRQAKQLLDDRGVAYDERRYLDDAPDEAEIEAVLDALGLEPWDITRTGEDLAKELGVKGMAKDRSTWVAMLAANPRLIERPIVITADGRAAVGRPTEAIEPLL
jgi:arsenate reductase (glutaredoxin)